MKTACRRMSIAHTLLFGTLALAPAFAAKPNPTEEVWLSYEPVVVELEGKLIIADKFGPPNYGENPETDEKVRVPILVVSQPINVKTDVRSDINTKSFKGVKEIQLVFVTGEVPYEGLVGKRILVKGTLFQAHTSHHYTDVLMTVSSVRKQKKATTHP